MDICFSALLSKSRILVVCISGTLSGLYAQVPVPEPTDAKNGTAVVETFPKWQWSASLQLPLRKPQDRPIDQVVIMQFMTGPGVQAQITNHLGGDFYVGTPDPPLISDVPLTSGPQVLPGIGLAYRQNGFMEAFLRAHYYRLSFHGEFPITVLPQDPIGNPHTVTGSIAIQTQGLLLDLGLLAVLAPGKIRPYVRSGIRGQMAIAHATRLQVKDLTFDWPSKAEKNVLQPYAGAGVRIEPGAKICIDAGLNMGYLPGLKWQAHGDIGVGLRF